MNIGGVLGEAWGLYRRFFWRFFLTALVVFAVLGLISAFVDQLDDDDVTLATGVWGLVSVVVSIVGYFWVQGALVEAVRDVRDGRADQTIGELYRAVQPRLPALIAAGVLAGIGIALGLVLLIVPGLYLLTIWSMIVPAIVLEGRSAGESFGRSRELVRGNGWSVFGLVLIVLLGSAIVSGLIAGLFAPLPDFLDSWLGNLVANSVVAPFVAAALTVAYFRLRGERPETVATPAA